MGAILKLFFVVGVVFVLLPRFQAEMISQCVTVGTEVKLNCPVDDYEGIYWFYDDDIHLDYDYSEANFTAMLSTNSYGRGYETYKISCRTTDSQQFYFAVVIVTDAVLPIQPSLEKGQGDTLVLSWDNPSTTLSRHNEAYYNYQIRVKVTDGYQTTLNYSSEAHKQFATYVNLTGLECKHVEVAISLPGNCQEKTVSGALLITPKKFEKNATSRSLYSSNQLWGGVVISFTPPLLCPRQEASYILSFEDEEGEEWSRDPVEIEDSGGAQEVIVDTDKEPQLKRERNYILRVTIVTHYANISSTTNFSTEPLQESPGALTGLKVVGYSRNRVNLAWKNPDYPTPSFTYVINVIKSGVKISSHHATFLREEDPFISIDMRYECEPVEITVAVYGRTEVAQSVNVTLPSYATVFTRKVQVETSLYDDGTVQEVEISFTPPRVCEFQRASYMLEISGGNRTWSTRQDPVAIRDSLQPVEIELETGFSVNTLYTATVTVFTDYANISSSQNFSFQPPDILMDGPTSSPESYSLSVVGGAVGGGVLLLVLVLVCGFGTGVIVVYQFRRRKEKRQRKIQESVGKCAVSNPIYSGDINEELSKDTVHPLHGV